jgi:hypothetical protein
VSPPAGAALAPQRALGHPVGHGPPRG